MRLKKYDPDKDYFERTFRRWDWVAVSHLEKRAQDALVMLRPLRDMCKDCTMCRLGMRQPTIRGEQVKDHRVFSNMLPSRVMIIGQNPGYDECHEDLPFVGEAGKTFNKAVRAHGVKRNSFYITNTVKCATSSNEKPALDESDACEPYLRMEIRIMRPKLVVTLGAVAFERLCPGQRYSDRRGRISRSDVYGVKVFAIHHPSPRNLEDEQRKKDFYRQIELLCGIVKNLD